MYADAHALGRPPGWLVVVDVTAKVLLLAAIARISVDPGRGNLEGKVPGTRALTYPLLALVVPTWHALARSGRPYPWGADLLVTLPGFSDILDNRLDLYDRLTWLDDAIHLAAPGSLAAAVLPAGAARAPVLRRLEIAVASGTTMALAGEVWEYAAFADPVEGGDHGVRRHGGRPRDGVERCRRGRAARGGNAPPTTTKPQVRDLGLACRARVRGGT